jgi:hypothetical protein
MLPAWFVALSESFRAAQVVVVLGAAAVADACGVGLGHGVCGD